MYISQIQKFLKVFYINDMIIKNNNNKIKQSATDEVVKRCSAENMSYLLCFVSFIKEMFLKHNS